MVCIILSAASTSWASRARISGSSAVVIARSSRCRAQFVTAFGHVGPTQIEIVQGVLMIGGRSNTESGLFHLFGAASGQSRKQQHNQK